MLDKFISDGLIVFSVLCVCVCSMCLCGQPGLFGTSWNKVDGTWEQNHNDQIIIYKCTGLCKFVKQFLKNFNVTGLESCMN
jgi:hypothetical protein